MINVFKRINKKIAIMLIFIICVSFFLNTNMHIVEAVRYISYAFTDQQIKGLTAICVAENGSSENAIRAEASIMANLFEKNGKKKYGNTTTGFINYITKGGWFAKSTVKHYSNPDAKLKGLSATKRDQYIAAVKDVLVNGNRYFPAHVDEHDYMGDIKSVSNNGVSFDKNDRSKYIKDVTKIKNVYGATYTFYCFPDGKADPFGYISKNTNKNSVIDDDITDNQTGGNSSSSNINPDESPGNESNGGEGSNGSSSSENGSSGGSNESGQNGVVSGDILENIITQGNSFKGTSSGMGNLLSDFIKGEVLTIVGLIGNLVFAGITVILGVKYIWSSAIGKSQVLESLPAFVMAIIFFYLGESLVTWFTSVGQDVTNISSWSELSGNIIWVINTIVHYASFAGILVLGLRYMFASADGKSQIKTNMGALILGIVFVFAASSAVDFIIKIANEVI